MDSGEGSQAADDENILSIHARHGSEVITVLELDGTMRYETSTIYRLLGHNPEEVQGTEHDPGHSKWTRFVHPEDTDRLLSAVRECLSTPGESPPVEYRIRHADGSWRWFESRGVNLADDPEIAGVVVSTRDVTDRMEAEKSLRDSERVRRTVTRGAPLVLFALDEKGVYTLAEGRGYDLIAGDRAERVGCSIFELFGEQTGVPDYFRRALCGEEVVAEVEVEGRVFDARYSPMYREGRTSKECEITGVIGVATDITERRQLQRELEHRAFADPLTGLPNRRLFDDRLDHALTRSQRSGESLAVLFMDLDNFKPVNDTNGHDAGDELLVAVADRLRDCLRPEDTICRLGGDEFVILLEDTSGEAASAVAERVAAHLHEPFTLSQPEGATQIHLRLTASLGVAVTDPGSAAEHQPSKLLREADAAMYRAKRSGKARYEMSVMDT